MVQDFFQEASILSRFIQDIPDFPKPGVLFKDISPLRGTLQAAIDLTNEAGYKVVDVAVLINLKFLNKMKFSGREIPSLIEYT